MPVLSSTVIGPLRPPLKPRYALAAQDLGAGGRQALCTLACLGDLCWIFPEPAVSSETVKLDSRLHLRDWVQRGYPSQKHLSQRKHKVDYLGGNSSD